MVADRAYLKGARMGKPLTRLDAEVASILAVLSSTGAMRGRSPSDRRPRRRVHTRVQRVK